MSPKPTRTKNTPTAANRQGETLGSQKGWKKIALVAGIVLISIPLAVYAWLTVMFSGGIRGVISGLKSTPNPHSSSVVAKRNAAVRSLTASFARLESDNGFNSQSLSTHDQCYRGQHSLEVHDDYAHRCTYRITKLYGFNGDFRQRMIRFERALYGDGWESASGTEHPLKEIMEDYYDAYYGDKDPQVSQNIGGKYLVSNLPTPSGGYLKYGEALGIEYAERETADLFQMEYAQQVTGGTLDEIYGQKHFQPVRPAFDAITKDNTFVLAVSIQKNYFEN